MLSEWLSDIRYRLRALFRRAAVERELDDELRFHLERETEKHVEHGQSRAEAIRRARLAFGGVDRIKEESRDARGLTLLDRLGQDLHYALRGLKVQPGLAAAVIGTLALGIGANAAMFGVVDRLMFRPPAYLRDPGRVHRVTIFYHDRGQERNDSYFEFTRYRDFARWSTTLAQSAGFANSRVAVGRGDDAREMPIAVISASLFDFFDARPAVGRFFTAAEDTVPVGALVAVLSYAFWESHYGKRPDVIGQAIHVGPGTLTIVGVAPEGFVGMESREPPALFVPITTYAAAAQSSRDPTDYYTTYHWGWMQMLLRRKPGVSVAAASADLTTAYQRSYAAERELSPGTTPVEVARPRAMAAPIQLERGPGAGADAKVVTWVGGVVVIVLLIACANVANLLLGRALRRRREIAVRLALGVSRGRLLSQLLTESLVLAFLGGVAGLLIGQWGGGVLRALFIPRSASLGVIDDSRTVIFASLVTLLAGVLTGLAPALHAGRGDLATTLKSGAREGTYHRSRIRTGLLVLQGALSVVLLVGAGLFLRSLGKVRSLRLGYDVEPVLYITPNYRGLRLSDAERTALMRRVEEAAKSIPDVESATRALTVPFWESWSQGLYVAGIDSVRRLGHFTLQGGSPDYFRTVGTQVIRGRGITVADREGAPLVAVVSEAMSRTLWPGKDAIGQCMRMNADTMPCITIVGIAENISSRSLGDDPGTHYYLPIEQFSPQSARLLVRTRGEATQSAETVRRRLQELLPGESYLTVVPMRDIVGSRQQSWQFGAKMFMAFGALALVLAAIGLYSVIAFNVAQRTQELGVRIALGAEVRDLVRLVVGEGLRFAAAGLVIGIGVALLAARWVGPLLFDESPRDPLVFGSVATLLLGVATIASAIPALRASRVDPNVALRTD